MIQFNQFYVQKAQTIVQCGKKPSMSGLSKISLFKVKEPLARLALQTPIQQDPIQQEPIQQASANQVSEDSIFLTLLEESVAEVYFRKRQDDSIICWDLFYGDDAFSRWLVNKIESLSFDFLLWPKEHLSPPKLMVFDMDSTFIKIEVIDELARRHGVGDLVSKVTEAAMQGELDFTESLVSRVSCLKGLSESVIDDIAKDLPLSDGVERLVKVSKVHQIETAIVSGGFMPFVKYLEKNMGLFQVKANELQVKDGKLTGKVIGHIVDAEAKAIFVNTLKNKLRLLPEDVLTIGDGANDLCMMKESGFSLAYRAKPKVQKEANGRMNDTTLAGLLLVFEW